MHTQRIGFVGVGHMGGAMAQRLLDRGWPVAVCDIDPNTVAPLAALAALSAAVVARLTGGPAWPRRRSAPVAARNAPQDRRRAALSR